MKFTRNIYHDVGRLLKTAKVFQNGRSQAVRLPKEFRFSGTEVLVRHFGTGVLLLPMDNPWEILESALAEFEPGLKLDRYRSSAEARPEILGR
jgi:antitoxin VapB